MRSQWSWLTETGWFDTSQLLKYRFVHDKEHLAQLDKQNTDCTRFQKQAPVVKLLISDTTGPIYWHWLIEGSFTCEVFPVGSGSYGLLPISCDRSVKQCCSEPGTMHEAPWKCERVSTSVCHQVRRRERAWNCACVTSRWHDLQCFSCFIHLNKRRHPSTLGLISFCSVRLLTRWCFSHWLKSPARPSWCGE